MEGRELNPVTLGIALVPVSALVGLCLLLSFGERSEPAEVAPVATLVSEPSAQPCVMLCDKPDSWTMSMPAPSTSSEMCPPFCEFERW